MTAEDLRKAILQQAIQGKLVPQNPNDEPASILLERIREEKARLVKEKKIKKDKNESIIYKGEDNSYYEKFADGTVKCIDDEIPFEIPDSWSWERWGNLSQSIQYGYNAPALNQGDIRMVRISDIQNGDVLWESVPYCNINQDEIGTYLLQENDILFARTGGTVGKSFLVKETPYPAIYAGYLIRTRYSRLLSSQYMKYFMESNLYWTQLKDGTIATAQPNCNGKTLGKMILPIPPLSEQYRIVTRIDILMRLIAKYERSKIELDILETELQPQLKKSILQYAIQGKLVTQNSDDEPANELLKRINEEKELLIKAGKIKRDKNTSIIFKGDDNKYYEKLGGKITEITEEIPYELPNKWTFVRLSNLCWLDDGTKASGEKLPYLDAKYHRGKSEVTYLTQGKIVEPPCKAILVDGENSGEIFNITEKGYLGSTFKVLQISKCISEEWLHILLNTYRDLFKNSKVGAAIPHLNKNLFRNLIVGLPPFEEQHRIVRALDNVLASINRSL